MYVVSNSLTDEFVSKSSVTTPKFIPPYKILMLCSLKNYKGINEFVELSGRMPTLEFHLLLNARMDQIQNWIETKKKMNNLYIYGPQRNLHPYYSSSHIVINLSHPDSWIETFGLTALEAMAYGLPVVVPDCGGIAELVEDGINGFRINVTNLELIQSKIIYMLSDPGIYMRFSNSSREKSRLYNSQKQCDAVESILLGNIPKF